MQCPVWVYVCSLFTIINSRQMRWWMKNKHVKGIYHANILLSPTQTSSGKRCNVIILLSGEIFISRYKHTHIYTIIILNNYLYCVILIQIMRHTHQGQRSLPTWNEVDDLSQIHGQWQTVFLISFFFFHRCAIYFLMA